MKADHTFELQSIPWAEYTGDEQLYITWTSVGVSHSALLDIQESVSEFDRFSVDANSPLIITNVSSVSAHANDRLLGSTSTPTPH